MTNDNKPSIPFPNSANSLATTNNILSTVIQSMTQMKNKNEELPGKCEAMSKSIITLESLLTDKVAPSLGLVNEFFEKHKESIENILVH